MNATSHHLSLPKAWLVSAATGFLALAWEIVWMRLYNFTTASRAIAFGVMLGSYLLGLAVGSLLSRRWQQRISVDPAPLATLGNTIFRANLAAFLVVPVVSWLSCFLWWPWTLLMVLGSSAMLGIILPLLCHLAIPADARAGQRMAGIYLANILGSGAGSLITGFVLMEHFQLRWMTVWLAIAALALSRWLFLRSPVKPPVPLYRVLGTVMLLLAGGVAMEGLWERLQYRSEYRWGMRFAHAIESRHGVITVDTSGTIYGNGTYDGSLDTSLREGSWLVRPYFIAALHPKPQRVLVIGVSGGAWTQILVNHPDVKEVIGVELSDAYLKLIRDSPSVSSLLSNPKVTMVVDDGRRWLRQHPEERFDMIVMNTTHHWREFASALLSREFLTLARSHLNEGGLVAWNTTESSRAAKTGMSVFPHTMMIMNFCVGSNVPLVPDAARWRSVLERWSIDGRPVFDLSSEAGKQELGRVAAFTGYEGPWDKDHRWRWMNRARMETLYGDAEVITDDNLGHEFAWGNW